MDSQMDDTGVYTGIEPKEKADDTQESNHRDQDFVLGHDKDTKKWVNRLILHIYFQGRTDDPGKSG